MNESHLLVKRNKLFIPRTIFSLKEKMKVQGQRNTDYQDVTHMNLKLHHFICHPVVWNHRVLLTDRRDPALALATDSFSFSAARRWTAWKLLRAAEKSFISRSLWIFCCLWTPQSRGREMVWNQLESHISPFFTMPNVTD